MNTNKNEVAAITDAKFFTGGNATFTVANSGGEHFTFLIRKPKPGMPYFVKLMTGTDNEKHYSYIGLFQSDKNQMVTTAKSKVAPDSKPVKVFNWAVGIVATKSQLPAGYTIQHDGKCCCCGRKLTNPESITSGIGPECAKKAVNLTFSKF